MNLIDGCNYRMEGTEERVSELEDRTIEIAQSKQSIYRTIHTTKAQWGFFSSAYKNIQRWTIFWVIKRNLNKF